MARASAFVRHESTQGVSMQGIPTRILSAAAGLLVVALCAPATLSAQQQQQQLPPEVQEWAIELQELQSQLQPLQEQALQEPEIQAEQASVVEALFETMVASNPETAQRIERLEGLMQEAQAAQEAGDAERIAQLSAEAAELQPQIQAAQAEALSHPDVQPRVAAFQQKLNARVVEIDPAAEQVIERIAELDARIAAAMQGTPR